MMCVGMVGVLSTVRNILGMLFVDILINMEIYLVDPGGYLEFRGEIFSVS